MFDAIWHANGKDRPVVVLRYLGESHDGRKYVSVQGSQTGLPLDELRFINPDDPLSPYISAYVDNHGRINLTE